MYTCTLPSSNSDLPIFTPTCKKAKSKSQYILDNNRINTNTKKYNNHYGEVNSFLRFVVDNLRVDQKLIIIRDPYDIVKSTFNWNNEDIQTVLTTITNINIGLKHLVDLIDNNKIPYVKFELLTADLEYTIRTIQSLGVQDALISEEIFQKRINSCDVDYATSFDQLPSVIKSRAKCLNWFKHKYY